ncbi:MAG: ribosome maturation factor RimM [Oscillospiraceae bacterium]|jgi:16S rRNA processing protein RimM|nr:ribosome maturation factor RimM [Oscillospiraceae bacterium]
MEGAWLEAGEVAGVHGIHGELKIRPWCDGADFLLPFRRFALEAPGGGARQLVKVQSSRAHKGFLLLKLGGIDTRDAAQALRGFVLYLDRADASLPEGRYFLADLIGLTAFDESGAPLGIVTDIIQPPAHDVYHVTGGEREHWVPAVPQFVREIDIANRRIVLSLIEGM